MPSGHYELLNQLSSLSPRDLSEPEQDLLLVSDFEPDSEAFREKLNSSYYPARVDIDTATDAHRDARIRTVQMPSSTIGFVRFASDASVDPGPLGGYHVNIPLAGSVLSSNGFVEGWARPGTAMIFSSRGHTSLRHWPAHAAQLCIKIDAYAVENELESLLGRRVASGVTFDLAANLNLPTGRQWIETLGLMLSLMESGAPPAHLSYLERLWIGQLLFNHNHQFTTELREPAKTLMPRTVKRVTELLDNTQDLDLTLGDLAREAGVGIRQLQQGFRDHLGTSPSEYLRATKLDHVHAQLVNEDTTVSSAMERWGFHNPGRFAVAYHQRFGENPSETLHKSR